MQLQGENVYLRALEPEDLEFLYQLENNSDYWHLSNTQAPYSKFAIKQYLERSLSEDIYALRELRLIICSTKDNSKIGIIDLVNFDPKHKRAEIGIIIYNPSDRGFGYGSESLEILINYAFDILYLHQLYCDVLSDNKQSINIFLNKNFKEVGIKKDWNFNGQNYADQILFQLINPNN